MKGKSCSYDYSFKILLIGDSGVGKSTILLSFISNSAHGLSPTIGVDFKVKTLNVGGKRLKLTIWDTAGQERFGILTSSYYRGAHGIIMGKNLPFEMTFLGSLELSTPRVLFSQAIYDVTQRESFLNVTDIWAKEVELYSTNPECIKFLVGNKVDRETERAVSREEGMALAWERKCSFFECSAKTRQNVQQCFIELVRKIVEAPALLEKGSMVGKQQILKQKQEYQAHHSSGCCS